MDRDQVVRSVKRAVVPLAGLDPYLSKASMLVLHGMHAGFCFSQGGSEGANGFALAINAVLQFLNGSGGYKGKWGKMQGSTG